MDWISTIICEKALANGEKYHFLLIVDRASGFVSSYQLSCIKTKHIISALQKYIEVYFGLIYITTSDRGPKFKAVNDAIKTWCIEAGIKHELSSAFFPQSNG